MLRVTFVAISIAAVLGWGCSGESQSPSGPIIVPIGGLEPNDTGLVQVNDASLYYEIYGDGEPLLLIPGTSDSHTAWNDDVPAFAAHHRAILYDPRGTGQSSALESPDLTIADMADDAAGLLAALNIPSAHVYGVSMGGMVAQQLALRHPDVVSSLILGATTSQETSADTLQGWIDPSLLSGLDAGESVADVLGYQSAEEIENLAKNIKEGLDSDEGYPSTSPDVIAAQLAAAARHNTRDRLGELRSPTLILHGDEDRVIPVTNAEALAEEIPDSTLVVFEGADHSYRSEVDEASDIVLDFLRNHPLAGQS